MTYAVALIVFVILIALVTGMLWGPVILRREKVAGFVERPAGVGRESYGGPPGMQRAASAINQGWPSYDRVYEGSSASAIAHVIDRT